MSNFGVVSTISAPVLKSVTQPDLIQFETEYAAYKEKVIDINRTRDENQKITPASIRNCIEPMMLHSLAILGQIPNATSVEETSDENVKSWFDSRLRSAPRDLSERVRSAVQSVKFELCKEDPAGAALTFVLNVVKSLDRNNASEVITDKERCKSLIVKLINKLEPPELRERIKDAKECWTNEEKSSLSYFQERVAAVAVDVMQGELARERLKRKRPIRKFEDDSKNTNNGPKKKSMKPNKHPSSGGSKGNSEKPRKKQWKYKCLNPACNEKHMLKDCKITNEDQKKKLLDDYYSKEKSAKALKESVHQQPQLSPDDEEGRYLVRLEDCTNCVALGDTGSDVSAMPSALFKKLLAAVPSIEVRNLANPISFNTAIRSTVDQVITFTSSQTVVSSVTIVLPGSNIPVRIRGVKFSVVDQEMDEVLLGRPFLKAIGFDLREHLLRIHKYVDGKHIDEIQNESLKISAVSYQGLKYQAVDDDPIDLPDIVAAGIGKDSEEEISKAFDKMLNSAKENGISGKGLQRLNEMLRTFRDIFRIKLGSDPPAKVREMQLTLVPDARPYRSPQRRYSPEQRAFLIRTVKELESAGAIYKNPSAKWASPALAVPKPGSTKLRFTVDLRGPNSKTIPFQSALPHLESRLQETEGAKCYANFDMAHGYWQFALAAESQEVHSIQTPIGVYTPRRLLQGGSDSGNHFQAEIEGKLEGVVPKYLQWIDDFLLFANDEEELLENIEKFFRVFHEFGLKLHAEKSCLFTTKVKFCGRVLTPKGVQYDPRHFNALLEMQKPITADQLQQLLCATNWMRNAIPVYAKTIAPLHDLMEDAYQQAGKRTKRAVRKIRIDGLWGPAHDHAFDTIKKQLAAATKLAHPKQDHNMCLFTDASETHWASVLTQTPTAQRRMDIDEQFHEPLCFLSGAFTGSSSNWSVPEKEGFAIVESMCRLDYLISGNVVSIYTDHANLVYIYDPYGRNPSMPRHTASKLMRWALKLSAFRYIVEHLPGERNVWADMLTRWAVPKNSEFAVKRSRLALKALMVAPIDPSNDRRLDWPNVSDIRKSQNTKTANPPQDLKMNQGLLKTPKGVVWIPENDKLLKMRIMIAAHTGLAGHRGWRTTKAAISSCFFWKKMDEDVESFVQSCIHCLCTSPGKIVPRPLAHTLHASKPNEMIHFDFCYMTPGERGMSYALIIKDDLSGYVWLVPTENADAKSVANTLLSWFSSFGVVRNWVSDRGSHFKNELIRILKESLQGHHHFTLAYCPWSNGTVEVVCRELLRASRALLSEFKLSAKRWPSVLPLVQSALNSSILPRLGGRCPLTVFTGLPQDSPLSSILLESEDTVIVKSIEDVQMAQAINISSVQKSLESMHRDVEERSDKKRKAATESHNRKTNVRPVNFTDGDYVLRGVLQRQRGSKPSLKWLGPFRIVSTRAHYIFEVEDLLTKAKEEVHGRRLKLFRNKSYQVTEELRDHIAFHNNDIFLIERFDDIRNRAGTIQVLVAWKGFGSEERDWLDVSMVRENVPNFFEGFIDQLIENGNPRQKKLAESI